MFENFTLERIDVGDAVLRVRHGGSGPPVLLLHGHPRTHATWHMVAPLLAGRFTVVCPDLRGYGESSKPPTTARPRPVLQAGHGRRLRRADAARSATSGSAVAGHDRGIVRRPAAWPWTIPAAVRRLCLLEGIPIGEALARCDAKFAAQLVSLVLLRPDRAGPPSGSSTRTPTPGTPPPPSTWARRRSPYYQRAIHDPAHRARHGRGLPGRPGHRPGPRRRRPGRGPPDRLPAAVPVGGAGRHGRPLRRPARRSGATGPTTCAGTRIDCGHHMAEEAPAELAAELAAFFAVWDRPTG